MTTVSPTLTQNQTTSQSAPPNWFGVRIGALLCFLVAFTNLFMRVRTSPLDPDEYQHAHDAWLIFHHQRPFIDFFEHHPPHYWYFLTFYYRIFGENLGIFSWGRGWMMVSFAACALLVYLIGKEIFGELGGLIAGMIFSLNRFAQGAALIMRPDGFMVLFMLAGVYIFIKAWQDRFPRLPAILAGLLFGSAFSIHPRAGFTILAFAIAILLGWTSRAGLAEIWQRRVNLILFATATVIPILIPFFIFGFRAYLHDVYYVSSKITLPFFAPGEAFQELLARNFALFPLVFISIGVAIYDIWRDRRGRWLTSALFWSVGCNIFGILGGLAIFRTKPETMVMELIPPVHVFYVFIPTLALFTARGLVWLLDQLQPSRRTIGIYLFILLGIISNLRPDYWRFSQGLPADLAGIEKMNRLVPVGERFVGPTTTTPIFRLDGSYYWFDVSPRWLRVADPNLNHDFIAEFERTRPYMVHTATIDKIDFDPAQAERMKVYLNTHYHPLDTEPTLLIRNQ